jgi:hypothetical protein
MHNTADPCTTLAHADQQGMVDHRAILDFVATGRAGRLLICLSGYGNKKVEIIMPGWSASPSYSGHRRNWLAGIA